MKRFDTPPIEYTNTQLISWEKPYKGNTHGVIEASTLGMRPGMEILGTQVWDDSTDRVICLVSHKTGEKLNFALTEEFVEGLESELTQVLYTAMGPKNITLTIFND